MGEYRVVISQGDQLAMGGKWAAHAFLLPHPKTGALASFLVSGGCLQEVNWYKQRFGSWFAGDTIIEDGGLYLCTRVDSLFLALPILEANTAQAGMFCEAEVLLEGAPAAVRQHVTPLIRDQLACLCDVKEAGGDQYYRLSQARVLGWLCCKVRQTVAALRESGSSYDSMDEPSLQAYAVGLLGEYLSDSWQKRLSDVYQICTAANEENVHTQPHAAHSNFGGPPEKRQKLDPKEFAKRRLAEKKAEEKAAKLVKQAAGMRKMTSFFVKPKPA
ncbi:hypothetical protein WJX72_010129 [[Myrmecia] bisecta]|uniref:Ribonuclease H2 subunit B n=1 Tax=[Myrmecia] bisecta TaxID=41462 RepID=A0AAW1Q809_9CHLO